MKKNMIIGIALAMGILSVGAVSASAAEGCGRCTDKLALQKFTQETEVISSTLKAKELELRGLYTYDGIDANSVNRLESEIQELKERISASATSHGISACSRI